MCRSETAAAMLLGALLLLAPAGCSQKMAKQPSYHTYDPSGLFADGRSARPPVPGTVSRESLPTDSLYQTGMVEGEPAERFPFAITREVLERGRERYDIYCSPCHDRLGTGNGMVVQRGFSPPPSYHIDRLRAAPPGHFVEVMTNGFGAMPSYAFQIAPRDRWAIAAWIRVLQLSRDFPLAQAPPDLHRDFEQAIGRSGKPR